MYATHILLLAFVTQISCLAFAADPPKPDPPLRNGDPVKSLEDLIKVLKDGPRREQGKAAVVIRDHYAGNCLDAIPQMAATMGQELARPYDEPGAGLGVDRMIAEAAHTAGPGRLKVLFELTTAKDPLARAGAYRLLLTAGDNYLRVYTDSKEKSELDLGELIKACRKGVKDEDVHVRTHAVMSLDAVRGADAKLVNEAVELLAGCLDDRKLTGTQFGGPAIEAGQTLRSFGAGAKPALKAIAKAAASEEESRAARTSCGALGGIAQCDKESAPEVVAILRAIFTDTRRKAEFRTPAMGTIGETGRAGEVAIADLVSVLDEPKVAESTRRVVYQAFQQLGASAGKATPALVKALQATNDLKESWQILEALKAIGPAAGEAIKPLESWLKGTTDEHLKQLAEETLIAIK